MSRAHHCTSYVQYVSHYGHLNTVKHRLVVTSRQNMIYVPSPTPTHIHRVHLWATHSNRYWLVLSLALAQWAAGRGYWKSGAAHTLDIYKTTNHWNHRNVLFHFHCQTSCHADHTAVTQPNNPHCTTLSFPSLLDFCFLALTLFLFFLTQSLFLLIQFFLMLSLSWSLWLSYLLPSLSITSLCPAWVTGQADWWVMRSIQVLSELQCNTVMFVVMEMNKNKRSHFILIICSACLSPL